MLISITKERLNYLYKNKKLTTYEIARIYNCCQTTVWKRLHRFDIKTRFPWDAVNLPKEKLEDFYTKRKLSTWAIEEKLKIPRSTIHRKLLEYKIKRRNRAESHIVYPRRDFSGNKLEKAYLIGFAMGDLRVRKIYPNSETIHIDCGSTKKEQINLISTLFKRYGRVWTSRSSKKGKVQIECSVNSSFDFLLKKRILIDKWILRNKKYFSAFLAGFTDAEGCISIDKNKKQAYYSLGNYNKPLLSQIRNFLIRNQIHCSRLNESKVKGKICFDKYFHNQNYWHFRVCAKSSLLSLFKFIDLFLKHRKKRNDMKRAIENINLRNKLQANKI